MTMPATMTIAATRITKTTTTLTGRLVDDQLFWLSSNGLEDVVVVSPSPTMPLLRPSQFPEAVVLWTAADSVTTGKEDTVGVVSGPRCLGQGYVALF